MAKAIEEFNGLTRGHAMLGARAGGVGSVRQQVHDGDTITVAADGNFGIRFLAIDAPETSYTILDDDRFLGLNRDEWEAFLSDPFAAGLPPFDPPLDPGLQAFLQACVGPGAAGNHRELADIAEDVVEELVLADIQTLGQTDETFRFFLAFAHEITDGYGRLLCYFNRDQPDADQPEPRPNSYNERLLERGVVAPYFIWPNINPYRAQPDAMTPARIDPPTFRTDTQSDSALNAARGWVAQARTNQTGIFDANNPLRIQPFEVRFLSRRNPPYRWVIDISANDSVLIQPQNYYTVPNIEDRLFIPAEYVPLFVESGWQRQP